jgi:predicted  nucleic acid-binding Zn-ribbon protein
MAILPLLYRVQELENRLSAISKTIAAWAEEPNLVALQLLQQKLATAVGEKTVRLQQDQTRRRRLELELQTCQERLDHEEKRLYDGSVGQARELEQIQQKAAEYRGLRTKTEDELLQLMESEEQLTGEVHRLEQRQGAAAQEQQRIEAGFKQQELELRLEEEQLQAELEEITPQIPPEWLEKYRRIAKGRRGIGIAKLKQNSCGACHVSLSEYRLQQVKRGEDILCFCENCGRILYYS